MTTRVNIRRTIKTHDARYPVRHVHNPEKFYLQAGIYIHITEVNQTTKQSTVEAVIISLT